MPEPTEEEIQEAYRVLQEHWAQPGQAEAAHRRIYQEVVTKELMGEEEEEEQEEEQ